MDLASYIRIQGRDLSYRTQKPVGIFSLSWRLIRNNVFSIEDEKIFVNIEQWFKDNLPEPPIYTDDNSIGAITYFKVDSTYHMIEKLNPVIELFRKHNIAFDIVYTDFVGKIIYEDEYQVAVIDE
ncbi:MAG: hypothetical protein K0R15_1796 [Clostridiales bacterium]|jgi:hypothetical protein|nr:hypothetical protein [Clostridiales bacterium]